MHPICASGSCDGGEKRRVPPTLVHRVPSHSAYHNTILNMPRMPSTADQIINSALDGWSSQFTCRPHHPNVLLCFN